MHRRQPCSGEQQNSFTTWGCHNVPAVSQGRRKWWTSGHMVSEWAPSGRGVHESHQNVILETPGHPLSTLVPPKSPLIRLLAGTHHRSEGHRWRRWEGSVEWGEGVHGDGPVFGFLIAGDHGVAKDLSSIWFEVCVGWEWLFSRVGWYSMVVAWGTCGLDSW